VPSKKVTGFCDEAPEAQFYGGRVLLSAIFMIERTLDVRFSLAIKARQAA
jgi:hypothetical protein